MTQLVQWLRARRRMPDRDMLIGTLFGLAVATIWSSWTVATRFAVVTRLGPADVTFLRFGVSALVLWPVLWRHGLALEKTGKRGLLVMLAGAGAPFMWVAATGLRFAPATHMATLMIGVMPIWVALFSVWFLGERLARRQWAGLLCVVAGGLAIGLGALLSQRAAGEWKGDLLFLAAAAMFAAYTLVQRRTGISSWQAAALVNVLSALIFAPLYFLFLAPRLGQATWTDILVQAVAQGLWVAVLGLYCYAEAVRRLGAARAAVFGALSPALAAVLSTALLGEAPGAMAIAGVVVVSAGVMAVVTGRPAPATRPTTAADRPAT
jgi:drug/metabolite transporter (DMT)-like permease